MLVELYGLKMEADGVTCYLWSPWRSSALEHRMMEAVKATPGVVFETAPDELRVQIEDSKVWKQVSQNLARVLKGWQEEATDVGNEKRNWRWLIESDTDASGYDMNGERSNFWIYARLSLDRGGPGDSEKGEDFDLNGFGICVWTSEQN